MNWYKLYSPKYNMELIEKLLKKFKIEKYNFVNDGYGDYFLLVECGLYTYKLEIHEDEEMLYIFKKSTYRGGQKSYKEYHTPCKKIHSDIWYDALKLITKGELARK